MNVLYQSAFLKALGWSLLDSFWQMGVLWLVYILLTGNRKKFNSTQKHTLALLSLAGGAFWFLISLISRFYHLVKTETPIASGAADSSLASSVSYLVSVIEPALPFLSLAYLVSIAFFICQALSPVFHYPKAFLYRDIQGPARVKGIPEKYCGTNGHQKGC